MLNQKDTKKLIDEYASKVANAFLASVEDAKNEEDVRQDCNKILDKFIEEAGLALKRRNEYPAGSGRIDTKYGDVIIEYKDPKSSAQKITTDDDAPGTKAVIKQIQGRFEALSEDAPLFADNITERLFGVGLDGDTIVYIERIPDDWKIFILPVTAQNVKKLLRVLATVDARGRSYTPENLAEDFGSDCKVARDGIKALYNSIIQTDNPKAQTFFRQWKIIFGEVCGYDIEGKSAKLEELSKLYEIANASPAQLLFAVHTYYSIFMKLLAAEVINSFTGLGFSIVRKCCESSNARLKQVFNQLEDGGIWKSVGYSNFLEGNIFLWYIDVWDDNIAETLKAIASKLDEYDETTLRTNPYESRDLLKKLYHELLPRKVRHDLGEYYTPDWLAEYVLDEIGYDGNPDKRILDPACGSGTFLVMIIRRILQWYRKNRFECGFGPKELVNQLMNNIIGFDLNPLAVLASRTNYIIALRELLPHLAGAEIPVYLCDSIITPANRVDLFKKHYVELKVAPLEQPLGIPAEIAEKREYLGKYADIIESCIANEYESEEFVKRCENEKIPIHNKKYHKNLYEKLLNLDKEGKNGVWARIIKNAFAPLFIERVDYVAGNPPWVNWESLPENYRDSMKDLWVRYGLFSLKGHAARLGGGKKDLSMIFTYSAIDNYLVDDGKLGFVITQSIFKTKGAGDGFRRFRFDTDKGEIHLNPMKVTDMSSFQPFVGAANRTAVIVCEKSKKAFEYPVSYSVWNRTKKGKVPPDEPLDSVKNRMKISKLSAIPVDEKKKTSPWLTAPKETLRGIKKVIGKSDYIAHAGACTWLNGVYWVKILKILPNGNCIIRNLGNIGKKKNSIKETVIEPDYLYPLLRGRDVKRWYAEPKCSILMVQDPKTKRGILESDMKIKKPKTYAYLFSFKEELMNRSGYRKYFSSKDAFYTMYDVGEYTMAEWKVVWKDMGNYVCPAVISRSDSDLILPEHHVMFVSFDEPIEAHYLAAILGSSLAAITSWAYTTSYGKSTHLLEHIAIPRFNPKNKAHLRLSVLSQKCHEAAEKDDKDAIKEYEKEIDELSAQIWGITKKELKTIQKALKQKSKGK